MSHPDDIESQTQFPMGAMVNDPPCPECEPCAHTAEEHRIAVGLGRQLGKTRMVKEYMRYKADEAIAVGHKTGMSTAATTVAVFEHADGPVAPPEKFDLKRFRQAAEALHTNGVSVAEAKQQMMAAMANLTPEEIPLVERELARIRETYLPLPLNRAERRRAAKARRRA